MTDYKGADEIIARTRAFFEGHLKQYLSSGGAQGHIIDFSHVSERNMLPTLLLQTTGRKSGRRSVLPLIYGVYAGEWVIIASKGGSPEHPAWYLNMLGQKEVQFQVGTQAFRATWRSPEGTERKQVWDYMATLYPPYNDYQTGAAGRIIPVVMMKPTGEVPVFREGA